MNWNKIETRYYKTPKVYIFLKLSVKWQMQICHVYLHLHNFIHFVDREVY